MLYGIESETTGYPREASSLDDGALIWLFPRADKDLLAQIRNPKLPQSHFATFHNALANAFLYDNVVVSWCGAVTQPDIIAEMADFFVRFDQVELGARRAAYSRTAEALGPRRASSAAAAGDILRAVVDGLGTAGGHDKRAGGAIPLTDTSPEPSSMLRTIRHRLLDQLHIDEQQGRRLLETAPSSRHPDRPSVPTVKRGTVRSAASPPLAPPGIRNVECLSLPRSGAKTTRCGLRSVTGA